MSEFLIIIVAPAVLFIVFLIAILKKVTKEELQRADSNSNNISNSSNVEGVVFNLDGARGRHLDVYENKVVITVNAGLGSFLTGNVADGEKTIFFSDCIGIQFKKAGGLIGYLQFETSGAIMNNQGSNFFNENTFTWDLAQQSNEDMEEVAKYCKKKVEEYKTSKDKHSDAIISSADELRKYKELYDDGVISQEEFEAKKKQLLNL